MKKHLFIHAGPGKTASTYFQDFYLNNLDANKILLVYYPLKAEVVPAVRNFIFSQSVDSCLISSESLARWLSDDLIFFDLSNLFSQVDIDVNIMLFCRNPVEHLVSDWMQRIKNNGAGSDLELDDFIDCFDINACLVRLLERCCRCDKISLFFYNFSKVRSNLIDCAFEFIPLSSGLYLSSRAKLAANASASIVNRSLGLREVSYLRFLKKHGLQFGVRGPLSFGWFVVRCRKSASRDESGIKCNGTQLERLNLKVRDDIETLNALYSVDLVSPVDLKAQKSSSCFAGSIGQNARLFADALSFVQLTHLYVLWLLTLLPKITVKLVKTCFAKVC